LLRAEGPGAKKYTDMKSAFQYKKPKSAIVILPLLSEFEQCGESFTSHTKQIVSRGLWINISKAVEGNTLGPIFSRLKLRTKIMIDVAEHAIVLLLVQIGPVLPDY